MEATRKIFTKGDRELLRAILKGQADQTKGVPISRYTGKVIDKLTLWGKKIPEKNNLMQIVFRGNNNHDVWLAVYEVCNEERPGLFEELQKEQEQVEMMPAQG